MGPCGLSDRRAPYGGVGRLGWAVTLRERIPEVVETAENLEDAGMAKTRRYWKITGRLGSKVTFDHRVPRYQMSNKGVEALLQCLVSRHLDEELVVDCFKSRNVRARNLEVRWHRGIADCGDAAWYTASVVEEAP